MKTVLDHVAIGTRTLPDAWDLFGGLLGGSWVYGGDSPGFWWGQLRFSSGPKIELLTPSEGPDAAFLERFLTSRGPGPHHFNFIVPDINLTLSRVRALGIEPVRVGLERATWKEAFLHPRDADGIVIQVAEQSGRPPELAAPAELPAPGPRSAFTLAEHYVADIDRAIRLFTDALDGEVVSRKDTPEASVAELTWDNGARIRVVQENPAASQTGPYSGGGFGRLHFARDGSQFSPDERSRAADLARRLGVSLHLAD